MRPVRANLGYRPKYPLVAPPIEELSARSQRNRKRSASPPKRSSGAPEAKRARAPPETVHSTVRRNNVPAAPPVAVNGRNAPETDNSGHPPCNTPPDTTLPEADSNGFASTPPPARFATLEKLQRYLMRYAREGGYTLAFVPQTPLAPNPEEAFVIFYCTQEEVAAQRGTSVTATHTMCPFRIMAYNTDGQWHFTVVDPHHSHPQRSKTHFDNQRATAHVPVGASPNGHIQPHLWLDTTSSDVAGRRIDTQAYDFAAPPNRRTYPNTTRENSEVEDAYSLLPPAYTNSQFTVNSKPHGDPFEPMSEAPRVIEDTHRTAFLI